MCVIFNRRVRFNYKEVCGCVLNKVLVHGSLLFGGKCRKKKKI